jgi:hypothetical protein
MTDPATPASPALLDIYLALAHVGAPDAGPLAPLAGEEPEEAPRLYIAHTAADGLWRVVIRPDLPVAIREQLAALPPETLFSDYAHVAGILAQGEVPAANGFGAGLWIGRTLLFPDDLAPALAHRPLSGIVRLSPKPDGADHYGAPAPDATQLRPALAPPNEAAPARSVFPGEQFAALADGLVAATCVSARESALAAEAWVRTLPVARGHGYATRVTAAWALDVRRRGKTPFYSYSRENHASAGVARALGLIPFLDDVGYL